MKKINNRGFTLIELLAVVVILLAISVIAVSSISAAIERNKAKQDKAKVDVIVSYAEVYYDDNRNSLEKNLGTDDYGYIYVSDLDLSDSEKKDSNGNEFDGCVKFKSGGTEFQYLTECP